MGMEGISQGNRLEGASGITEEHTEEYAKKLLEIIQLLYSRKSESKNFRMLMEQSVTGFLQTRLSNAQIEKVMKTFEPKHLKLS
jgi:hypothetical protein